MSRFRPPEPEFVNMTLPSRRTQEFDPEKAAHFNLARPDAAESQKNQGREGGPAAMSRITLIGAGSSGFARSFLVDIMSRPGLTDATVSLMDIDLGKLAARETIAMTSCSGVTRADP